MSPFSPPTASSPAGAATATLTNSGGGATMAAGMVPGPATRPAAAPPPPSPAALPPTPAAPGAIRNFARGLVGADEPNANGVPTGAGVAGNLTRDGLIDAATHAGAETSGTVAGAASSILQGGALLPDIGAMSPNIRYWREQQRLLEENKDPMKDPFFRVLDKLHNGAKPADLTPAEWQVWIQNVGR